MRKRVRSSEPILRRAIASGAVTSAVSAGMLMACGKATEGSVVGPLNGPSQWIWGEAEAYTRRASLRHTLVGYAIHHFASTMWAGLHETLIAGERRPRSVAQHLAAAAATTAISYVVDYKLTPRRLRPGFKKHLGAGSMLLVYGAFACGMSLLPILRDRRR